jgi:hypothetical protein
MKGDDYSIRGQIISPTGYKYNKKARCLLTVRKYFVEWNETALISFSQSVRPSVSQSVRQSVSQSVSQNIGPISSATTHYDTDSVHMYNLLCNLFYFTALSRLNKVRLWASIVQSVQRLRYGLNCQRFGSNRRRDTFPFPKTSSPDVEPS